MSLTVARGNLTRGINAVQKTCRDVGVHLDDWSKMATMDSCYEDIVLWIKILYKQMERMKQYSKVLIQEAEKMQNAAPEEVRKNEDYFNKFSDALDEASNTMDLLEIQCERGGENPLPRLCEQLHQLELMELRRANVLGNQSVRTMSREQILEDDSAEGQLQQEVTMREPPQKMFSEQPSLPKFDGKSGEFQNFWTMFQELVGSTNQSNLIKMNHLLNHLEGEPKDLLKNFRLCNKAYPEAVQLLQKTYKDGEKTIAELTEGLAIEEVKSSHITEQRKVLDQIILKIDELKDFHENVENRMMKIEILKKFSPYIRKEVLRQKLDVLPDEWTTERLLKCLEFAISRQEQLEESMKEFETSISEKKPTGNKQREDPAASKPQKWQQDQNKDHFCVYCKEKGHFPDQCKKVATIVDRRKLVCEEERCAQCLTRKHSTSECQWKPCRTCQKKGHHSSICYRKSKGDSQNAAEKRQNEEKQKNRFIATTVATRGYIPTLTATAQNPSNGDWESISMMIDSGADQTYITRDIAQKWKLPLEGTETFPLRTFGSASPSSRTFDKTSIQIKTGETTLELKALVSENLAGRIWKDSLTNEDLTHMLKTKIDINEDVLAEVVEPQLIIGCDYFSELIIGNLISLPSGIKLLNTHLGYTTIGRGNPSFKDTKSPGGKESVKE